MEILSLNNDHIKNPKLVKEYGCVCDRCGTVFIFKRNELSSVPRSINPDPKDCMIKCPNPNCQKYMTLNQCEEFNTDNGKQEFKNKYDE